MLITALEKEREQIYEQGIEEGKSMLITSLEKEREQIYEKGIEKGKYEDAKIMFAKGMSISLVSEITGIPEEKLLKLKSDM